MSNSKRIITKQLGELLLDKGIINQAQLDRALKIQRDKGGLIGQIFVMLGYVKEEEIAQVLTVQYGFPYLPLERDRKSTRLNSSHITRSRMPSSA